MTKLNVNFCVKRRPSPKLPSSGLLYIVFGHICCILDCYHLTYLLFYCAVYFSDGVCVYTYGSPLSFFCFGLRQLLCSLGVTVTFWWSWSGHRWLSAPLSLGTYYLRWYHCDSYFIVRVSVRSLEPWYLADLLLLVYHCHVRTNFWFNHSNLVGSIFIADKFALETCYLWCTHTGFNWPKSSIGWCFAVQRSS